MDVELRLRLCWMGLACLYSRAAAACRMTRKSLHADKDTVSAWRYYALCLISVSTPIQILHRGSGDTVVHLSS
jgi:hypothetical protein